jgi:hypothetical protein
MILPISLIAAAILVFVIGLMRLPAKRPGGVVGPLVVWLCLLVGGIAIWTLTTHAR